MKEHWEFNVLLTTVRIIIDINRVCVGTVLIIRTYICLSV